MHALCLFALSPTGLRHQDLRGPIAQLRRTPYGPSQMTYDLRRLRLHGLIARIPRTHRYQVTDRGARIAMFYVRIYNRALRPALSLAPSADMSRTQRQALDHLDRALGHFLQEAHLAA